MNTSVASRGAWAERLAARFLQERGYRIHDTNVRVGNGELDIIAYQGEVLCFVEVRSFANPEHGDPLETITPLKIRHLIAAARGYLEQVPEPWPPMRFDAVGVVLTKPPRIQLVQNAFEA